MAAAFRTEVSLVFAQTQISLTPNGRAVDLHVILAGDLERLGRSTGVDAITAATSRLPANAAITPLVRDWVLALNNEVNRTTRTGAFDPHPFQGTPGASPRQMPARAQRGLAQDSARKSLLPVRLGCDQLNAR